MGWKKEEKSSGEIRLIFEKNKTETSGWNSCEIFVKNSTVVVKMCIEIKNSNLKTIVVFFFPPYDSNMIKLWFNRKIVFNKIKTCFKKKVNWKSSYEKLVKNVIFPQQLLSKNLTGNWIFSIVVVLHALTDLPNRLSIVTRFMFACCLRMMRIWSVELMYWRVNACSVAKRKVLKEHEISKIKLLSPLLCFKSYTFLFNFSHFATS